MRYRRLFIIAFCLWDPGQLHAQTDADSVAVVAAALDYIEGWYEGDSTRMARALHPDLVKRIVRQGSLQQMGKSELVGMTARKGPGADADLSDRLSVLDIFQNAATVRIDADQWVDFLQLSRIGGHWVIVNVLWEMRRR